jgi:predicted nucleic acid-binding protein
MGLTVVDAGVLIGFLDRSDAHHASSHRSLSEALVRNDRVVLPACAFAEVLVGPSRRGAAAVATVRRLIDRVPIEIGPVDEGIAAAAAELRARHTALRLPDALVLATAQVLDADVLVTTDRKWPPRGKLGLRATITKL